MLSLNVLRGMEVWRPRDHLSAFLWRNCVILTEIFCILPHPQEVKNNTLLYRAYTHEIKHGF